MNKTEAENIMMMRYACIIDAVNQSVDDLRSKREIIESASEKVLKTVTAEPGDISQYQL